MRFILLFTILFAGLFLPGVLSAQTDTEFWFVAPEVSKNGSSNMDIPIYLRITSFAQAGIVTVAEPANALFTPIVVNIGANSLSTVDLSPFLDMVENKPANSVLNYGLHITSTCPVSIYYEVASTYCMCNPELFTLKGRNAVGTNFLIPTQNYFSNSASYTPTPYNAFDIVATADNTTVTITPSKAILGHAAGVTFTVNLNRGQSWSGLATSQAAANHLWGTIVTADKPVAITMTDDLLYGITGCADLIGDQIVPVNITGTDYVVVKGNLTNNGNRAFILATQDNTDVFIDGNATPVATLNKGQLYDHNILNPSSYINTSLPSYVFQTSGFGCELGGALIPAVNCTGSTQVAFTRTTSQQLGVVIATRLPEIGNFLLNGTTGYIITSDFAPVPGTGGNWQSTSKVFSLAQVPVGTVVTITNTSGPFHLGLLIGDVGGGCSYGYFSDFARLNLGPDLTVCEGNSAVIHAGMGWDTYLWSTGATTEAITVSAAGQYSVIVGDLQCTLYDTIQLNVNPAPHPDLGPDILLCGGSSATLSTTGGPYASYLWSTGETTPTITVSTAGIYTLRVTTAFGCTALDVVNVTKAPDMPVSVSISAPTYTLCQGSPITFTAVPVNPGPLPVYQWFVNGTPAGTNSDIFTFMPVDGDLVSCTLTSSLSCTTNNPASSYPLIQLSVSQYLPVGVTVSASASSVCQGTPVNFTATPINPGATPVYQWIVNGLNTGTNSSTFTYNPANNDLVSCQLTSSLQCTTNNPASSFPLIQLSVSQYLPVSITVSASATSVCQGTAVNFNATPTNPGLTPVYQWMVNGSGVGTNSSTYTYIPANNDLVSCQLTSSLQCTTNNPSSSYPIIQLSVSQYLPVSVTTSASSTSVCQGTAITLTATPANPGPAPMYQWKVNGSAAGTNSSTYNYIPANNDLITCTLTSNLMCTTNNPATSNPATQITVNPLPTVTLSKCFDTVTYTNARPFALKGGVPTSGTFSGTGVSGSTFDPALAGAGIKSITYTYQNLYTCSAAAIRQIVVLPAISFTCGQTLTDPRDGRTYPTVSLGSQCWMKTNLNYGSSMPPADAQTDNCLPEKYCYENNPLNCTDFGGLYQWDELMAYQAAPGSQGLCMPGWHVPTHAEWLQLFSLYNFQSLAGKPLQDSFIFGFNAKQSGLIYDNLIPAFKDFATIFWTSTPSSPLRALSHGMNTINYSVSDYPSARSNAMSVRCVRD